MARVDTKSRTIQSLYSLYAADKLRVNRRYQRKLVWTLEEKQRLIESVLNEYPIPAILVAEHEDGVLEIIDGLQRLHTLMSFIEQEFQDCNNNVFDLEKFPTAKDRVAERESMEQTSHIDNEGDSSEKSYIADSTKFLDYEIAMLVMRNASLSEIEDVFQRINAYGHQLSDQERRQSGIDSAFSAFVRNIAADIRGDQTFETLPLSKMPSISIDMPKTKFGYEIQAGDVFWNRHGILLGKQLRDSLDEQCLADLAACIVGKKLIPRTKDALDKIYTRGSSESKRIQSSLDIFGEDNLRDRIREVFNVIDRVVSASDDSKLLNLLYTKTNNNGFPAVFTVLAIAFYQTMFPSIDGDKMRVLPKKNERLVAEAIKGTANDGKIESGKQATSVDRREHNVNAIKGLIGDYFEETEIGPFLGVGEGLIDTIIRRSKIESPSFELKQGGLSLGSKRSWNKKAVEKIMYTFVAMANNGVSGDQYLLIGVADKDADADQIARIDAISPIRVAGVSVVGVDREAKALGISLESYQQKWRDAVENSKISEPLKGQLLSNMNYSPYRGLGVIIFKVPAQDKLSFYDGEVYIRKGDSTRKLINAAAVIDVNTRFEKR